MRDTVNFVNFTSAVQRSSARAEGAASLLRVSAPPREEMQGCTRRRGDAEGGCGL
jgi:hypothetical protein